MASSRRRVVALMMLACGTLTRFDLCAAAAPLVYHTPGFESPVQGGPDELLFIGGAGFRAGDRVVYELSGELDHPVTHNRPRVPDHPAAVPDKSTRERGVARIVKIANPPYALTALLPKVLAEGEVYRLWVVTDAGEWSEPLSINDPRPMWFSPSRIFSSVDIGGLQRHLRIVGRNLQSTRLATVVRLRGPKTYLLKVTHEGDDSGSEAYVTEVELPERVAPGAYTVAVSRGGSGWVDVPNQLLIAQEDPAPVPLFSIADSRFGSCSPSDHDDDSDCLARAILAAGAAGGGIVEVPQGTWDLYPHSPGEEALFVLPRGVSLRGAGPALTTLLRHTSPQDPAGTPLLLVEGDNSIRGLRFVDERHFNTLESSRSVIQLGHRWDDPRVRAGTLPQVSTRIVICDNAFRRVGEAIADAGIPIEGLIVTHNDFGGYTRGLALAGISNSQARPYRIEDSVIRWNRFVPGSYIDLSVRQGVIASELGGSRRVDFSSNEVAGNDTDGLQEPTDQPGFRAAFFWAMHDSSEMLLVEGNRIACPGDKAGDGEAIAFDGNGGTLGYVRPAQVIASTVHGVTLRGALQPPPPLWAGERNSYYVGHWIVVLSGPGLGQARRIRSYRPGEDGQSAQFDVWPAWDVQPARDATQVMVTRQFWQSYVIGNRITQARPVCRKSNLTGPSGGEITVWAPSADSVIAHNRQVDTSGIGFTHKYSSTAPSCPACDNLLATESALEVRENRIQGEYEWDSDCSLSGIHATYGASPTPEAPPPTLGFGVQIAHNEVEHADGLRGGAIDVVPTWFKGPDPPKGGLINNLILAHNVIRDVGGHAPRPVCRYGQAERTGVRIEGAGVVEGTVLYGNVCAGTGTALRDSGKGTIRVCPSDVTDSCECP